MKALPLVLALFMAAPAGAAVPAPSRVQVAAHEFRFGLSRLEVTRGAALVELVNFGEDPHDLHLQRRARGAPVLVIREVLPGGRRELRARLAPGRFRVWCSVGDHVHRGMVATLTVTKRS